jgi:Kef-type K+ transport system membrane component KefB
VPEAQILIRLVIALAIVVVATRLVGALARKAGQSAVVGEIAAGILLGPSVFGALAPEASAVLLPPAIIPPLQVLAELGVVFFMFRIGLELDTAALARDARTAFGIAQASIVLPALMGIALSWKLHPSLAGPGVAFWPFALFVGVSMAVTAFPVLARILLDFGLLRTPLGAMAMSVAAIDDVTAWCLLAAVTGLVRAEPGAWIYTAVLAPVFALVMLTFGRALLARLASAPSSPWRVALLIAGMLASAAATHAIGIHAIFGAFLFGALVPVQAPLAHAASSAIGGLVGLMMPAFFAVTGLRTEVGLINGAAAWGTCLVVLTVACAGKIGGAYLSARWAGVPAREAAALGALMNTRGLVGLVVINLGLSLGVITPAFFAMLVLMALTTTAMTSPLLQALGMQKGAGASFT